MVTRVPLCLCDWGVKKPKSLTTFGESVNYVSRSVVKLYCSDVCFCGSPLFSLDSCLSRNAHTRARAHFDGHNNDLSNSLFRSFRLNSHHFWAILKAYHILWFFSVFTSKMVKLPWNICMHSLTLCVCHQTVQKVFGLDGFLSLCVFHFFYYQLHFLYICQLLQTTNKQHVQFMTFPRINSNDRDVFSLTGLFVLLWKSAAVSLCCCRAQLQSETRWKIHSISV